MCASVFVSYVYGFFRKREKPVANMKFHIYVHVAVKKLFISFENFIVVQSLFLLTRVSFFVQKHDCYIQADGFLKQVGDLV